MQARAEIEEAGRHDLIETDDEGHFLSIRPEAGEDFNIRNDENTSKVEALEEALDSIFDPSCLEVKDAKEFEYLAAYSLSKIEDYVLHLDYDRDKISWKYKKKLSRDYKNVDKQQLGHILISAMDAVGCAERLREAARIKEKYEKKIDQLTQKPPQQLVEKIRQDLLDEAKEKRKQDSVAKNDIRHERTRINKKIVFDEFEKDTTRFKSFEEAGEHCRSVLRERGWNLTNRTVVGYVRERAKQLGVRYR